MLIRALILWILITVNSTKNRALGNSAHYFCRATAGFCICWCIKMNLLYVDVFTCDIKQTHVRGCGLQLRRNQLKREILVRISILRPAAHMFTTSSILLIINQLSFAGCNTVSVCRFLVFCIITHLKMFAYWLINKEPCSPEVCVQLAELHRWNTGPDYKIYFIAQPRGFCSELSPSKSH